MLGSKYAEKQAPWLWNRHAKSVILFILINIFWGLSIKNIEYIFLGIVYILLAVGTEHSNLSHIFGQRISLAFQLTCCNNGAQVEQHWMLKYHSIIDGYPIPILEHRFELIWNMSLIWYYWPLYLDSVRAISGLRNKNWELMIRILTQAWRKDKIFVPLVRQQILLMLEIYQ